MRAEHKFSIDNETPEKKKKFIRELFDSIVPTYDFLNRFLSFGIDTGWRKKLIRLAGDLSGKNVLDLCCGTGDLTKLLRNKKARVFSLDFSIPMLKKGYHKKWLSNLIVAADASRLPFKDSFFHYATIAFGIRNIPDLDNFIMETNRVLTPGGKLYILELTRPKNKIVLFFYNLYLKLILPFVGGLISRRKNAYRYLSDTISTFVDVDELSGLLRENGFAEIRVYRLTFGVATIFECLK